MTMVQIDFGGDFGPIPVAGFTPVQWAGLGVFVLGCVLAVVGKNMMLGNGIGFDEFGL